MYGLETSTAIKDDMGQNKDLLSNVQRALMDYKAKSERSPRNPEFNALMLSPLRFNDLKSAAENRGLVKKEQPLTCIDTLAGIKIEVSHFVPDNRLLIMNGPYVVGVINIEESE
jgi:hypothetical protein